MLLPTTPKSNNERQREFRERNPGYYRKLHARRRAAAKGGVAEQVAAAQVVAVRREPLMLPAPVETIEIPGMSVIPMGLEMPAREAVRVERADAA